MGAQLPAYPAYLVSMPAALHHVVDDIAVTDEIMLKETAPQTRGCGDVERRKRGIRQTAKRAGQTNLLSTRL